MLFARPKISTTVEHLLLVGLLVSIAGLFVYFNVLWRWDHLLYDTQLSLWNRAVPDDIIIIEIDDESLNQIGRWPWPRSIHAQLIQQLDRESPKAIGLDIIFSEADATHPESDQLLSDAIRASGKVVLPVFMSRSSPRSMPIEALPLPEFTQYAAQLGHVHIDVGSDGIARKVYLLEGIGQPRWQHYSIAMLGLSNPEIRLPDNTPTHDPASYSAMQWSREQPFLIPYAGPPGHFSSIGYAQVLDGHYPENLFHNKIVLIGATAEGLGDALPTPLSARGGAMPGVEIIANVIDALRRDLYIHEIHIASLIILTTLLVAIPMLIYPYLNPSHTLYLLFGAIFSTMTLVALTLLWLGIWIPLSTILLFQFLSYPLWSWRRLVLAMRHLNFELDQLLTLQRDITLHSERNLANELEFIASFIAVSGWVVFDAQGRRILHQGSAPPKLRQHIEAGHWQHDNDQCWASTLYQGQVCLIGLKLKPGTQLSAENEQLLDNLVFTQQPKKSIPVHYLEDVLQTRISQVQSVGFEYLSLHRIIDDSLAGMADGVLICNSHAQIMLSNQRASWYLRGDDHATIEGRSLMDILQHTQLVNNASWIPLLRRVILQQQRVINEAQHSSGRDLMVQISPLRIVGDQLPGFVLNFSDISMLKASERNRSEVLSFLSHDLRSPLSSMIAMIELAKNKTDLGEVKTMLHNMEKNTYKTLHLAEQFLQLSRAATNANIEFHDTDFNTVVLNAIDQLWALSSQLQVNIQHEFHQQEIWTQAEPDLLERAIINLLSNALKHSQPNQNVRVTVELQSSFITCCVIDIGSGIEAHELPHLFDMFRRTRGAGIERKQGSGLGLAFVDAVAKRHKGQVEVSSEPGKGSCFCLKIPQIITQDP